MNTLNALLDLFKFLSQLPTEQQIFLLAVTFMLVTGFGLYVFLRVVGQIIKK